VEEFDSEMKGVEFTVGRADAKFGVLMKWICQRCQQGQSGVCVVECTGGISVRLLRLRFAGLFTGPTIQLEQIMCSPGPALWHVF